jgi:hypothetical protein
VNKEPLIRTEVIRIINGNAKDITDVMRRIITEQLKKEDGVNSF